MKRLLKYVIVLLILLMCIYGFWLWLQYKWATVIKQTTTSIITELAKVDKLETIRKTFTKTIEGEQQLANLTPDIGINEIVGSALFKDKMVLDVEWEVSAWYNIGNVLMKDIKISRDGTVTIVLWKPEVFGVFLTWAMKTSTLGIVTQSDIELENKLRGKARNLILQEALNENILQIAKDNAQNVLQTLFLHAWIQIKEVIIAGTGDSE